MAAAGCASRSTTAPVSSGPLADPDAVSAGLATLAGVFDTPAIRSVAALGGLMGGAAGSPPAVPVAAPALCAPRGAGGSRGAAPLSLGTAGLIADSLHGRVFVYDTASRTYRASPDSSGPATGVRFLLYGVDSYSQPLRPLAQVGWLDLSDQGGGVAPTLQARIVNGAADNAVYTIALTGTQAADTALLTGTVTDGSHTFTFRDSTASAGFRVTISATAVDSVGDLHLAMLATRISFDPFDFIDSLEFSLQHAGQTVGLVGEIDTYCLLPSIGLKVMANGAEFASVTNGTTTPNVTRIDGQALTSGQVQAILDLKDAQQRLFRWLGAFFAPAKLLLPVN